LNHRGLLIGWGSRPLGILANLQLGGSTDHLGVRQSSVASQGVTKVGAKTITETKGLLLVGIHEHRGKCAHTSEVALVDIHGTGSLLELPEVLQHLGTVSLWVVLVLDYSNHLVPSQGIPLSTRTKPPIVIPPSPSISGHHERGTTDFHLISGEQHIKDTLQLLKPFSHNFGAINSVERRRMHVTEIDHSLGNGISTRSMLMRRRRRRGR
ncbi:Unknown protein, partial [Striga hermonthica]